MQNSINGKSLLMLVQSIASERGIPKEEVLEIFADALAQSLRKNSSDTSGADFRVTIDPDTGAAEVFRRWHVLAADAEIENSHQEIYPEEAREKSGEDNLNPGDIIEEPVLKSEVEFEKRISMLSAKQYLNAHLRDAERQRLLNELLERNEDLINGQVLRLLRDKGDAIIEVLRVDCRLPKREMIPRENIKVGDRVQALIKETITDNHRGKQIILTRTSPDFLIRLFQRVVPEVEKGILEIVAAVRSPGNRAKIAVRSHDPRVDPVGTCVGIKGSRVQAVTDELKGERIDIIHWDEDDAKYVLEALKPTEVSKIHVDRERHKMDVLVEKDLLAQAIGKNGTNVRLASDLTGWQLNLMTPEDYSTETEEIAAKKSKALAEILNLDEDAARILFDEGFEALEQIAYAQSAELLEIEGFDEEIVEQIQERAKEAVEKKEAELQEKMQSVDERLRNLANMNEQLLYELIAEEIMTLEDVADLSIADLLETIEIPSKQAEALIMEARAVLDHEEEEERVEQASETPDSKQ